VLARLAAGEDVDPSEYTFRTSVTIETADAELAWVDDGVFIAVGGRRPSGASSGVHLAIVCRASVSAIENRPSASHVRTWRDARLVRVRS
jgi:hypothetical protein